MSNETKYVFTIDQLRRFCELHMSWWWDDENANPKWEDFLNNEDAEEFLINAQQKSEP